MIHDKFYKSREKTVNDQMISFESQNQFNSNPSRWEPKLLVACSCCSLTIKNFSDIKIVSNPPESRNKLSPQFQSILLPVALLNWWILARYVLATQEFIENSVDSDKTSESSPSKPNMKYLKPFVLLPLKAFPPQINFQHEICSCHVRVKLSQLTPQLEFSSHFHAFLVFADVKLVAREI